MKNSHQSLNDFFRFQSVMAYFFKCIYMQKNKRRNSIAFNQFEKKKGYRCLRDTTAYKSSAGIEKNNC